MTAKALPLSVMLFAFCTQITQMLRELFHSANSLWITLWRSRWRWRVWTQTANTASISMSLETSPMGAQQLVLISTLITKLMGGPSRRRGMLEILGMLLPTNRVTLTCASRTMLSPFLASTPLLEDQLLSTKTKMISAKEITKNHWKLEMQELELHVALLGFPKSLKAFLLDNSKNDSWSHHLWLIRHSKYHSINFSFLNPYRFKVCIWDQTPSYLLKFHFLDLDRSRKLVFVGAYLSYFVFLPEFSFIFQANEFFHSFVFPWSKISLSIFFLLFIPWRVLTKNLYICFSLGWGYFQVPKFFFCNCWFQISNF